MEIKIYRINKERDNHSSILKNFIENSCFDSSIYDLILINKSENGNLAEIKKQYRLMTSDVIKTDEGFFYIDDVGFVNITDFFDSLSTEVAESIGRELNLSISCMAYYNTSIIVPNNLSFEEAIKYVEERIDKIPITELNYVELTDEIDVENSYFTL